MLRNKVGAWALVASAAASWSTPARADSIVVLQNYEIERNYDRDSDEEPQTISLRDCQANFNVSFPTNISVTNTRQLKVWVGPNSCLSEDERDDGDCREVYQSQVNANNPNIDIAAQDIVGDGGEDCTTDVSGAGNAVNILLFAFQLNNGQPEEAGSTTVDMNYDVNAPAPPHVTSIGQGDGQLSPKWEPLEDIDVTGYRFYCQESSTTQEEVDAGGFDEAGAGGQGGQGGADSGGGCQSTMVAGQPPPEDAFPCGEQAGKSAGRGTVTDVENGRVYTVGVVSQDIVGNEGTLSNLVCQYPKEVTDFYEAYTNSGGEGGGGFCSIGHGRSATAWPAFMLFGVALGWASRRKRRP